jgi:predicted phosphodiesterase
MIFSDIHAPLHSSDWIDRGMQVADKVGSEILIINGDFIDANQISRHVGGYYRRKAELNDDIEAGAALLKLFSQAFRQVYFLAGNHCVQRMNKVFNGEVAAQNFWKMFGERENVKITARSFVLVNDSVVVGHPRQYSRIRGNTAQRIAQMWQKHVVLGHSHHSASTVTLDGKWQAIDVGCMAELSEFEYTTFEINDFPKPLNGFAVVNGERTTIFDHFTDWRLWKHGALQDETEK